MPNPRKISHGTSWEITLRVDGPGVHQCFASKTDGNGCEVVFTLRQRPEMTDEEFVRDADAVGQDLAALKSLVETD